MIWGAIGIAARRPASAERRRSSLICAATSSSERASRSAKSEKRVQPALATRMSRPPRSLMAVWTRRAISAEEPASALMVVVVIPGYFEERSEARSVAAVALEA